MNVVCRVSLKICGIIIFRFFSTHTTYSAHINTTSSICLPIASILSFPMDAEALRRTSMELGIADEPRSMKSSVNMNGSSWKAEAMRSSFEWKEKVIRESTIRYTTTSDKIKTERLLDKRGSFVSRNLLNQISSNSGMARLSTVVGYKRASRISAYDIGSDETENEEIVEDIWDSLNRIDMDVNVRYAHHYLYRTYRISFHV